MTSEEKKLIELLEFYIAEKNKEAVVLTSQNSGDKKHFYHGQMMAFTEVCSMLNNIKRTL